MDTPALQNEQEILAGLIDGSEKCFTIIYRHYSPRLYYKLLKLVKSDVLARDILQDVFLAVWKCRSQVDIEKSFRSYLFRIVANKTYDIYRKSSKDKKLQKQLITNSPVQVGSIEADINSKEITCLLNRAIESLPTKRKIIFKLCKLDGKSYDEISRQLGISASTVTDHIVKANLFIRQQILQHEAVADRNV